MLLRGILYGLGVGPGDSGLITEKGKAVLQKTEVLCIPKSKADRESVALAAVRPYLPPDIVVEELLFPMSRDETVLEKHWVDAAGKVAGLLTQYQVVTFITIGDPLTYSTFGYLLDTLRHSHPQARVEVIPGVPSYHAAAALLQVPLVESGQRLAVVPVPVSEDELAAMARYFDTLVFLKVSAAFDQTLDMLQKAGLDKEAYLVTRCGSTDECWTANPFALRGQDVDYLSLLIVKRRRDE